SAQQVEQIWFSGVHSDIGGGYPERALADITMAWMVERARAYGLALEVDAIAPDPFGELHDSMTLLYRLLRPYVRRLNQTDPLQCVASTAVKRHEQAQADYSPGNLPRYLADGGPVQDV